jgi:hypothetical protein
MPRVTVSATIGNDADAWKRTSDFSTYAIAEVA